MMTVGIVLGLLALPVAYFLYQMVVMSRETTDLTRRRNAYIAKERRRGPPTGLAALWAHLTRSPRLAPQVQPIDKR